MGGREGEREGGGIGGRVEGSKQGKEGGTDREEMDRGRGRTYGIMLVES